MDDQFPDAVSWPSRWKFLRREGRERSVVARFSIIRWLRLRFKRCPPSSLSLLWTVMGGCSLEDRSPTGWSSPLVGDESSLDYGFDDNPRPPPFVLVLVRNHRRSTIARVPDNGRETTTSLVISFIVDTFRKTEGGIERGEERWEESKIVSLLAYIFYIYIYISRMRSA